VRPWLGQRIRIVGAVALGSTIAWLTVDAPAHAQQQPRDTPVAVACEMPRRIAPENAASPDAATSSSAGTPTTITAVVGTPSPTSTDAVEVEAVARSLAACLSDGNNPLVARLATGSYLGQIFGGGPSLAEDEFLALVEDLPAIRTEIRSISDIQVQTDTASADVVSIVGHQLLHARWNFVRDASPRDDETPWRIDAEVPATVVPPSDAATIGVAMEEYEFGLDEDAAVGPNVVLAGRNGGNEDHEMLVLRLSDDITSADILRAAGPGLPESVEFIGQVTVPADDRADLVLVDLDPDVYTIICLLPDANGTPHLAQGMTVEFEVQ